VSRRARISIMQHAALVFAILAGVHGGSLFDKPRLSTAGLDLRVSHKRWAFNPAIDYVWFSNKDSDVLIMHLNAAYRIPVAHTRFVSIGVGHSIASIKGPDFGSQHFTNAELELGAVRGRSELYLSARSINFFIPVFRNTISARGVLVSIGARRALTRHPSP
jgi:hypothetical protein